MGLFACAELALRLTLGPPPPPVRVIQVVDREGMSGNWLERTDDQLRTTYQEMRPEPSFPVTTRAPRAAVLGGSSVQFGAGLLTADQEFSGLLRQSLGVDVLNLGAPGLDSFDLVEIAEDLLGEGAATPPVQALVVYAGHNDMGNAVFLERYRSATSGVTARALATLEHLQIFVQLRRTLSAPEGAPAGHGKEHERHRQATLTPARRETAARYFRANLKRLAWLAARRDVPVLFVVPVSDLLQPPRRVPCAEQPCARQRFREGRTAIGRDPIRAAKLLREARDLDPLAARAPSEIIDAMRSLHDPPKITVLDAPTALPQAPGVMVPDSGLFVDPIHLSAAGHTAMAEMLRGPLADALGIGTPAED